MPDPVIPRQRVPPNQSRQAFVRKPHCACMETYAKSDPHRLQTNFKKFERKQRAHQKEPRLQPMYRVTLSPVSIFAFVCFAILVGGQAYAAERWVAAEGAAIIELPEPARSETVTGGRLTCSEQRWSLAARSERSSESRAYGAEPEGSHTTPRRKECSCLFVPDTS